ncbi:MAG: phage baseplate assembly protein V [Proteobacteria bacterium]|nr:phage baseplate assembly protein V [Pseudomonadota bacterium]
MDRLLNVMKAHASALDNGHARPRFALVTSVDPATATARVSLQPEGVLSGWLPILTPSAGAGWGIWCPPSPGDQVMILAQEGDAEQGVIVGRAFSLVDTPPAAAAGELWLVHASGSSVRLLNSGVIEMIGPVTIQGTVTVSGDVLVAGNVSDQHATLADLRSHYDTHMHVDSRGGVTSVPTQQD